MNPANLSSEPALLPVELAWRPGWAGLGTWCHHPGRLLGLIGDPEAPQGLAVDPRWGRLLWEGSRPPSLLLLAALTTQTQTTDSCSLPQVKVLGLSSLAPFYWLSDGSLLSGPPGNLIPKALNPGPLPARGTPTFPCQARSKGTLRDTLRFSGSPSNLYPPQSPNAHQLPLQPVTAAPPHTPYSRPHFPICHPHSHTDTPTETQSCNRCTPTLTNTHAPMPAQMQSPQHTHTHPDTHNFNIMSTCVQEHTASLFP